MGGLNSKELRECLKPVSENGLRYGLKGVITSTPLATLPYSSIVSPSAAVVSSSSSPSIDFLAAFSASSKMCLGTSWCRPFVGPSAELIHVISNSKSLSLLSSWATYMIRAASLTPASSDRLPDARSSFSSSALAACLPFPVAAP